VQTPRLFDAILDGVSKLAEIDTIAADAAQVAGPSPEGM
jgi:hypothetical protein